MLSICLGGIVGSMGSDFTGVDGGGVMEGAEALRRERERVLEDPTVVSDGSTENGRVAPPSWCVRN